MANIIKIDDILPEIYWFFAKHYLHNNSIYECQKYDLVFGFIYYLTRRFQRRLIAFASFFNLKENF